MVLEEILEQKDNRLDKGEEFELSLHQLLQKLKIKFMKTVDCNQLMIDERAPYACQFRCKNYNRHYSCPPHSYTPKDFKEKLKIWDKVVIFAIASTLEEFWNEAHQKNIKEFTFLHKKILSRLTENYMRKILFDIEDFFKSWGFKVFGLAGGSCHSCKVCGLKEGTQCKRPHKMRMSLESVGVDVEKTFSQNGYDIAMPNYGSSIRAASLLIKGKLPKIDFCSKASPQIYISPQIIDINLLCDKRKIEFIRVLDIEEIGQKNTLICNSNCPCYDKNYSCPPYAKPINIKLWKKAILWKWKENSYKIHSYSKTIEFIHKKIFYQGHYFALPLRHCKCDYCETCTFEMRLNEITDLRMPCNRYKVLAPAMETCNIDIGQFGEGIFGLELI